MGEGKELRVESGEKERRAPPSSGPTCPHSSHFISHETFSPEFPTFLAVRNEKHEKKFAHPRFDRGGHVAGVNCPRRAQEDSIGDRDHGVPA